MYFPSTGSRESWFYSLVERANLDCQCLPLLENLLIVFTLTMAISMLTNGSSYLKTDPGLNLQVEAIPNCKHYAFYTFSPILFSFSPSFLPCLFLYTCSSFSSFFPLFHLHSFFPFLLLLLLHSWSLALMFYVRTIINVFSSKIWIILQLSYIFLTQTLLETHIFVSKKGLKTL